MSRADPMNPVTELRAFVRAALVDPVPRDHTEPDSAFHRRRVVVAVTLLVGAVVLAWALRIEPGDPTFYIATFALAGVWAVGAVPVGAAAPGSRPHPRRPGLAAGPSCSRWPSGRCCSGCSWSGRSWSPRSRSCATPSRTCWTTRSSARSPWSRSSPRSTASRRSCTSGARCTPRVGRRHAVAGHHGRLHARRGDQRHPAAGAAAAVVGLVVGLQRRVTGGILGPIITHLTWSLGMLFLLPPVLDRLS